MSPQASPLRTLAKTYANDLISRAQYVEIRAQLLKRLENRGKVDESDLKNFTALQSSETPKVQRSYTSSGPRVVNRAGGCAASRHCP